MAKAAAKSAGKKAMTKSQFVTQIAEKTGLSKKQVDAVLNELVETVKTQLGPKGAGKLVIPGLARATVSKQKAVKGGEKKINPLTGQEYITKDRPAFNKVRMNPVKSLKESLK
jgi:nucleoid DNA-binding protein